MATETVDRIEVAKLVEAARTEADRSVAWLARKAGISASSLRRKLDGEADFYLWEIARIAGALGRKMSEFLPAGWDAAPAAAGLAA